MKSFCLFCQKTALHNQLENGKGRSSGIPLLDVHGVSYFLVGKQCKQTVDCKAVSFFPLK